VKNPKAYLFWYIIAGLLVATLVVMIVFGPTDPEGRDASAVKQALVSEYDTKWKTLDRRSRSGSPSGVFDAEQKEDIHRLLNDYLITGKWKSLLDPLVKKYGENYGRIKDDLVRRSEVLREAVGDSGQRAAWYLDGYAKKSDELIQRLIANGALVEVATTAAGVSGIGANPADDVNRRRRDQAGFITQVDPFPEQKDHPRLTAQFRIIEAVVKIILATQAEPLLPNPALPAERMEPPGKVKLLSVAWKLNEDKFDGPIVKFATNLRLSVTMRGQESALSAAIAQLEKLDKPVTVMVGASVRRQEKFRSGERPLEDSPGKPAPAVMADATVDLAVLDFAPFAAAPSIEAEVQAASPTKGAPKAGAGKGKK